METNDGFTFKRRTANKTMAIPMSKMAAKMKKEEPIPNTELVFNIIRPNKNARIQSKIKRVAKTEEDYGKRTRNRAKEDSKGAAIPKETKKIKRKLRDKENKEEDKTCDQSKIQFNVLKKRKTIRLDKSIDLSIDSIFIEEPKGTDFIEDRKACESNEVRNGKAIKMSIPTLKEKIKSNEIYKKVRSDNINDLIKDCILFLNDNSKYANEVIKHCNANYFSDIDYRKEIENTNSKIDQIRNEISKWETIFKEKADKNTLNVIKLEMPEPLKPVDKTSIQQEFEEKANKLKMLDDKLKYFFEHAKEKSENLLKNVFGSIGEKNVDALFLLKAMSKLGR